MTSPNTIPDKYRQKADGTKSIEDNIDRISGLIDPLSAQKESKKPFYSTGAKCLLRIGGKHVTVANSIRWSISYNSTPIQTIDSLMPWDIDTGAIKINAEIGMIMDPSKGPERDSLFHIMSSAAHQPMVELQILDRAMGTQILFARGVFTDISGNVAVGSTGSWNARFVGVAYQHYINQSFRPYSGIAGAGSAVLDSLQNFVSDITGGLG